MAVPCSLVSKRFASLILQTRIVTVQFPKSDETLQTLTHNSAHNLRNIRNLHAVLVVNFLKKFTSIQTLELQLFNPAGKFEKNDSIVKCKPYFKNSKFSSFLVLFANEKDDDDDSTTLSAGDIVFYLILVSFHLKNAREGFALLGIMIEENIMFQKAVITNSPNYGTFFLGQEMQDFRYTAMMCNEGRLRLWYSSALRLSSGRVMKGLKLGIIKFLENDIGEDEDAVIVRNAFEGEQDKDCGEAAVEILKQNPILSRTSDQLLFN